MKEKVQEVLEMIRPSLQADGGDVELVDVTEDGIVKLKLTGQCAGCPMSTMTASILPACARGSERLLRACAVLALLGVVLEPLNVLLQQFELVLLLLLLYVL